jgi:Enhancer of polycomb-like
VTYTRSSDTVDECIEGALANGFTYYMDERDSEWLEKVNEEARGEGTSAQGAFSAPAPVTATRSGLARSAKARGKEPEVVQPIVISEDEFELVMGMFEKMTHEKTEFLHHVRILAYVAFCHCLSNECRVLRRGWRSLHSLSTRIRSLPSCSLRCSRRSFFQSFYHYHRETWFE